MLFFRNNQCQNLGSIKYFYSISQIERKYLIFKEVGQVLNINQSRQFKFVIIYILIYILFINYYLPIDIQISNYLSHTRKRKQKLILPKLSPNQLPNNSRLITNDISQQIKNVISSRVKEDTPHQKQQRSKNQTPLRNQLPELQSPLNSKIHSASHSQRKTTSWLDKVLKRKQTYADCYFKQIQQTRERIRFKTINKVFPEVRLGNWVIRGFVYENSLILKAQNGRQTMSKKFNYQKVFEEVNGNYSKWIKEKFG